MYVQNLPPITERQAAAICKRIAKEHDYTGDDVNTLITYGYRTWGLNPATNAHYSAYQVCERLGIPVEGDGHSTTTTTTAAAAASSFAARGTGSRGRTVVPPPAATVRRQPPPSRRSPARGPLSCAPFSGPELSLSADGFVGDLTELVAGNDAFRRVLYTSVDGMQLVAMMLRPGENIGLETHSHVDQFVRVEAGGRGVAVLGHIGERFAIAPGAAILVPAGMPHDIINTDPEQPLHLSVVYSRPLEPRGLVQPCREANV